MPQAGQRVGEYVLDAKIGGGTFGEVWRARHHVWTDQLVAIKIPTDPQYIRNLKSEGVAIHGLVHPNIVRAIGFDPYAEVPYLTMEYVPGSSLRPLIEKKTLTVPQVIWIMRQTLSGLKYAHDHNVIHRDIKPENILVHERALTDGFDVEGVIKITDFGLGKAANSTMGSIAYSASLNTPAAREIAGTLDYMAPEQRGGAEPQAKSDLYACGVILYEMLTGERPAGTDVPSDLNRSVPKYLDDVFRRSYARLDKRYASADEFLAALPPPPNAARPAPPPLPPRAIPLPAGRCTQCQKPVDAGDQFCMHCGVQLVSQVRRCPKCGAFPDQSDRYCIFCGESLSPQPISA
jgi:serine/threonine protein kinase